VSVRAELERVPAFAGLTAEQIDWLESHVRVVELEAGDVLFREGDPASFMFVVLEGEFRARIERGPSDGRLFVRRAGHVGGMLPYSRVRQFPVTGRAVTHARFACFDAAGFPEMLERIPELEPRLIAVMSDRVRENTRTDQQREKLLALGKLSAGLAHELNNPAAALRRSVSGLKGLVDDLEALALTLTTRRPEVERLGALMAMREQADRQGAARLDPVERSEREAEWEDLLADRGVARPWVAAEALVSAGLDPREVEPALAGLEPDDHGAALAWLAAGLAIRGMLDEAEEASTRISDLVAAVKSYSRLDEAPEKRPADVHDGIDATLAILAPRFREKKITVERAYGTGIDAIAAYPGELNQVWTNLLDNAADAVQPGGRIRIGTSAAEGAIRVEIEDDGAGIPSDLQGRIWEPFFTTKDVGQGTGLGLDIVRRIVVERHGGEVRVESNPGRTVFEVRLPRPTAPAAASTGSGA